jgi:hypothetical protein
MNRRSTAESPVLMSCQNRDSMVSSYRSLPVAARWSSSVREKVWLSALWPGKSTCLKATMRLAG